MEFWVWKGFSQGSEVDILLPSQNRNPRGRPIRQAADTIFISSTPPSTHEESGKDGTHSALMRPGSCDLSFPSRFWGREFRPISCVFAILTVAGKDTMDKVFKFSEPQISQLQNEENNNLTEPLCRYPGTMCSSDKLLL